MSFFLLPDLDNDNSDKSDHILDTRQHCAKYTRAVQKSVTPSNQNCRPLARISPNLYISSCVYVWI